MVEIWLLLTKTIAMKALKFVVMIIAVCFLTGSICNGQPIHRETVVTVSGINYGPGIGTVYGTYVTKVDFRINKEGFIENLHVAFVKSDLWNTDGETVRIVGTINDNLGLYWDFLNNPNATNTGWPISYDCEDGWFDEYMPDELPVEGHCVSLGAKLMCNGYILNIGMILQIHINANGDVIVKP